MIAPMNGASEKMSYYVVCKDLYEIFHEAHIATEDAGRNCISYDGNSK